MKDTKNMKVGEIMMEKISLDFWIQKSTLHALQALHGEKELKGSVI